jgi:hypothetical protein
MMKQKILVMMSLLLMLENLNCWSVTDICFGNKKSLFKNFKCTTKMHGFQCAYPYCSTDAKSCQVLLKLMFLFRFDEIYKKRMSYEKLISSLEPCEKLEYVWRSSSMCNKPKFCNTYSYFRSNILFLPHSAFKDSKCKCSNSIYRYDCGTFCTTDKMSCFKMPENVKNKKSDLKFKNC